MRYAGLHSVHYWPNVRAQTRKKKHTKRPLSTDLRGVYLHRMEGIDCDEDVSHICVNLISSIASLKLLCDRVLKKKEKKKQQAWFTQPVWNVSQTNESPRSLSLTKSSTLAYVLPQVKACDACYVNVLSSCHSVINSPVFSLPGQVHQQQQGQRCLPSYQQSSSSWRMGENIRWQLRLIVSFNASMQHSDLINRSKCCLCKRRCCAFPAVVVQQTDVSDRKKMMLDVRFNSGRKTNINGPGLCL